MSDWILPAVALVGGLAAAVLAWIIAYLTGMIDHD
jgi:hypothetical protein